MFLVVGMTSESALSSPVILVTNNNIIRVLTSLLALFAPGISQVILKRKEEKEQHLHTGNSGLVTGYIRCMDFSLRTFEFCSQIVPWPAPELLPEISGPHRIYPVWTPDISGPRQFR